MAIARPQVLVMLCPGTIDVAVVTRGKVSATACEAIDGFGWQHAWEEGLFAFDKALMNALRRLNVVRPLVTVLTDTPADLLDISSFTSNEADALQAGRFQMLDRFAEQDRRLPVAATTILSDTDGEDSRTHILTIATEDAQLQLLSQWCTRAGATLDRVVSLRAASVLARFQDTSFIAEEHTAVCHIDRSSAVIAAGANGRLTFVRVVDVGVRLFAEAYARGLTHEQNAEKPDDNADAARKDGQILAALHLLFDQGVPADGTKIGDPSNPHRASVVPLLSPVVQRLSVELKQTLRFGTPIGMSPPEKLLLTGPGSAIPGLCSALAGALEITVRSEHDKLGTPAAFGPGSTERRWAKAGGAAVALRPWLLVQQRTRATRSRALAAGVAVAAGVLGVQFMRVVQDRRETDRQASAIAPALDQVRAAREEIANADALRAELNAALQTTAELSGVRADWRALLAELASKTTGGIELSEVSAVSEGGKLWVSVTGTIEVTGDSATGVSDYVSALTASPLVAEIEMGASANTTRDGKPARRFVLRLRPHGFTLAMVEPALQVAQATASTTEAAP